MMRRAALGALAGVTFLSACADPARLAVVSDRRAGFATVVERARAGTGQETVWLQSAEEVRAAAERVTALVQGRTIGPDTAVQVALLNNRGLQAAYSDLGMSAAEVWQATLNPNPTVSLGVLGLGAEGMAFRAIEGLIAGNLLALATQERRAALAEARFRQAQLAAAEETLRVAQEARMAWIDAVAAFEEAALIRQAQETAEAGAELAERLGETGFLNRAGQAREMAFAAELAGRQAQARLAAELAKERLTRVLGLWGADTRYFVPDALPALPGAVARRPQIEAEALAHRVDLAAARLEVEAVAREHGLTKATRVLSDLDIVVGIETEVEDDGRESTGQLEVEFPIPIFDSGEARLRKAELAYLRAAHLLAEKAVTVRSEARSAHAAWLGAHRIARHYQLNVLPLRRVIEEEALLSYNGMITSTFDLLADIRGRLDANLLEVQARRDFWRADAALSGAIHGGGGEAGPAGVSAAPAAAAAPAH